MWQHRHPVRNERGCYKNGLKIRNIAEVRELLSSASCDVVEKEFARENEVRHSKCSKSVKAFWFSFSQTISTAVEIVWEKINQNAFSDFEHFECRIEMPSKVQSLNRRIISSQTLFTSSVTKKVSFYSNWDLKARFKSYWNHLLTSNGRSLFKSPQASQKN